jgi:stage II sporulation protein R
MRNIKGRFLVAAGVACLAVFFFLVLSLFGRVRERLEYQSRLSSELVRFHVRANSDSEEDQWLKCRVRDGVVESLSQAMSGAASRDEALAMIQADSGMIAEAARNVLKDNGSEYEVSVYVCREYFPVREYGEIVLPAGEYDALRIDIGEAKGHNWWCVLYPRLCFSDLSQTGGSDGALDAAFTDEAKKQLQESLSAEDYDRLVGGQDDEGVKYRFRILTWLNRYM